MNINLEKSNFTQVSGQWKFEKNSVKYLGSKCNDNEGLIISSDKRLFNGSIKITANVPNGGEIGIAFRYKDIKSYYFLCMGSWGYKLCIGKVTKQEGRIPIRGYCNVKSYFGDQTEIELSLHVKLHGSKISVFDGDIKLFDCIDYGSQLFGERFGFRAYGDNQGGIIKSCEIEPEEPECFVLMPFGKLCHDLRFEKIYKPIIEECNLKCVRVDKLLTPTPIIEDIKTHISEAKILIVDLTETNPNVLYELGYCHALNKEAILIIDDDTKIPFNIGGIRHIRYSADSSGIKLLEEKLKESINEVKRQQSEG